MRVVADSAIDPERLVEAERLRHAKHGKPQTEQFAINEHHIKNERVLGLPLQHIS